MKGTWGLVFVFFLLGCSQSYKLCEAPSCETHVLSNGLTVVLKEDHKAPVATAELWVRTGTINEDNATNGLSHYLEHVLFKPWKDGRRFDDVVESSGGRLNGGTYYDFTYYYGTVPSENLVAILQGLAYLMFEPIFDPKAMDLEREVVVQEINRTEDLPERILDDVFQETLFKVHPYHQRVLGPMENILNSPQDIVKRYYHDFYVPNNMVLVVVGDVDKTEVLKKAGEIYGKYPSRFLPEVNKSSEPERSAAEKRVLIKDVEQTYWMTGFRGPASSDPDYYVLEVIKGALSNGLSSRLNQHIKEEKKLVNSIGVSFDNRKEASVFAITASFKPEKEQEVEAAIADEFQQLKEQPVSSAELAKVKRLLRKNHIFGLETSESQADNLGYSMIVSDLSLVNNYLEKISAVSSEDIQRVARKYFTFPTTVVVRSK